MKHKKTTEAVAVAKALQGRPQKELTNDQKKELQGIYLFIFLFIYLFIFFFIYLSFYLFFSYYLSFNLSMEIYKISL
jgi:hypothetical protein